MPTQIKAIRKGTSSTEIDLKAGRDGDLSISQFLPPYASLVASGVVFAFDMSAGTAKVPVIAMPVASPEWGIYNAHSTKYLVLLKVAVFSESGTMGLGLSVVCAAAKGPQTAVTSNYTAAIVSCLDGSQDRPSAFITNNPTLLGGTPAWVPFDCRDQTELVSIGTGAIAEVDGLIMCPPKGMVCAEVVGLTGTNAQFDVIFVVAQLNIDRP